MGERVERWGIYEIVLQGPDYGNPYVDVSLSAKFKYKNREMIADGFYDGDGTYRIRFMPDAIGEWRWVTCSNVAEMDGLVDLFLCTEPQSGNHGPVGVQNRFHFAYADVAMVTPR
jgi:hypothetical protein